MTHKFIVTHAMNSNEEDSLRFCNGYIFPNHYDHSLEIFQGLFREAQAAFPHLTNKDVECLTITKSGWAKGCPILRFPLPVGSCSNGWVQVEGRLPDIYCE